MKFSQGTLDEIRIAAKLGRDRDIQAAVEKALGEVNVNRPWQEDVGKWISVSSGYFHVRECYKELGAVSTKDMAAIRQAILHYKNEGIIESWRVRGNGWYRQKERELIGIDWQNADTEPLGIRLPLGLSEMANVYNGDIIIIAGESNVGKTGMCLNIAELNMDNRKCDYFSSELGDVKIAKRISLSETPNELWSVSFHYRHSDYQDVLFKDSINIIDFIMQTNNFWEIGDKIKDIHLALKDIGSGIAVVAIQKSSYKELGRGGDFSLDLASLYITLSQPGRAKIVKLKDWKVESNPNHKVCDYKLVNASKFIQSSPWHHEEDENVGRGKKW